MSEGADPDGVPVRKKLRKWLWPLATFLVTLGVVFAVVLVREQGSAGAPAAPVADLAPAQHVKTKTWREIASDPSGHVDERVVLWGQVTAFDPATDATTFQANVDSARHTPDNGTVNYPTAVLLHGSPDELDGLAKGYIFTAEVTVDGAAPAAPGTIGPGPPRLTVTKLKVTDKTVG